MKLSNFCGELLVVAWLTYPSYSLQTSRFYATGIIMHNLLKLKIASPHYSEFTFIFMQMLNIVSYFDTYCIICLTCSNILSLILIFVKKKKKKKKKKTNSHMI